MEKIIYSPIGKVKSKFTKKSGMPVQPSAAKGIAGMVEVFPEYEKGLKDLDGFSHIILIYHFHKSEGFQLETTPFLDSVPRGIFAIRAPRRPNSIGLSVLKLIKIENNILYVENIDILDGTPVLDIKPYIPDFEGVENVKIGWLTKSKEKAKTKKSDDRFDF